MIRRPPRSTQSRSSAASDVYKRQAVGLAPGPGATTRQDAPSALRFSFLGPVVVEPDDRAPVEVRGAQPALVLAYLVLERPRPLLRDELVELLWPGDLPAHWEGAARQVVSRVRAPSSPPGCRQSR